MNVRRCPLWASAAAQVTRRLPAARYRAIGFLPSAAPFAAPFPADRRLQFICDPADAISREVFFAGSYEPQLTLIARALLAAGDVVADVGANWGYFTLLSAALVGAGGRVLSLEPEPRLFARLSAHVELNALRQVSCHCAAATARAGDASLQPYDAASGNRGTSRLVEASAPDAITVRGVALDTVLDEAGLDGVSFVKIDVEGAEPSVLEGMNDGLRARRYRCLFIEWHPSSTPAEAIADAARRLHAAGYAAWAVDHSVAATRRAAYRGSIGLAPAQLPVDGAWPHWLAVSRDAQQDALAALVTVLPRE